MADELVKPSGDQDVQVTKKLALVAVPSERPEIVSFSAKLMNVCDETASERAGTRAFCEAAALGKG